MRDVSSTVLTKCQAVDGHESGVVVELDTGSGKLYFTERDAVGPEARIIAVGSISMDLGSQGATVGSVSLKLADEDEYLLDLMCETRLEGRTARILLIFDGLITDPVELFAGRVGSPLVWEEENKTLSFDIVAFYQSGDKEIPFAPDEESGLQEFAWNREWPRIYGTPIDVPATLVIDAPRGHLIQELKPTDESFDVEVDEGLEFTVGVDVEIDVGNERMIGRFEVIDDDPVQVARFYIQERNASKGIVFSQDRDQLGIAENAPAGFGSWEADPRYASWDADGKLLAGNWLFLLTTQYTQDAGVIDVIGIPSGTLYGQVKLPSFVGNKNYILYQRGDATRGQFPWIVPSGLYFITIGAKADIRGVLDVNDTLHPPGTPVREVTPIKYVCSDLPAEQVLRVRAWRDVKLDERGGTKRELVVVPRSFYTVRLNDEVADRDCCTLEFEQPLDTRGAGWGQEVFVTLISTYGPNVADIVQHLVEEAGLTADEDSFDAVEDACENYPMNFAILSRRDALEVANDVAWQGRCGLVILGTVAYLKYLSVAPTDVVFTYGVDQVLADTLQLTSSETTEVSNDVWVSWRRRYSKEKLERIHLINDDSVTAFGRKKRDVEIYAYRHKRLVQKTADFWFDRWSRVWRKLRLIGDLDAIEVTVYDDVRSTQPELVIDCVVESLEHDTENDQIAALLWTPAEVGTCVASDAAFDEDTDDTRPADVSFDDPTDVVEEIEVSALNLGLNEPETHVAKAITTQIDSGPLGGLFDAKLFRSNNAEGEVVETSVKVRNLTTAPVQANEVLVVHKAADGTFYTTKAAAQQGVTGGSTLWGIILTEDDGTPKDFDDEVDGNDARWNTALTVDEESAFTTWRTENGITDSGEDYDYRGAYKAGLVAAENGHWPDQFKKPNHPTFSDESRYAYLMPHKAGQWNEETYIPPDDDPDHYFAATLFKVTSGLAGDSLSTRFGRLIGGSVYDGQRLPIYLAEDGTAWAMPIVPPFALAKVKSASGNPLSCRLYLTADFNGEGEEDITVKLPVLVGQVSADTWILVIRVGATWVGYLPLIRPRVV